MLPGELTDHRQEEPPPRPLTLQAGPLALLFEPQSGFVRRICLDDREVLRGIYVAVRDRNWGTVPARVVSLKQEIEARSFDLNFAVQCRAGDIQFRWNGRLSGASDGTLRYVFDGEALTTFLKNRIGFCILHPLRECCGAPARYERADGSSGEVPFPRLIEPQIFGQSTFSNLRRLAHEVQPGRWAELEFEGDLFETEDQRNWTDASFKTYCTPLALPFPVEVKAGTGFRQTITLRLTDREQSERAKAEARPTIVPGPVVSTKAAETSGAALLIPRTPAGPMPRLGLGSASHDIPLSAEEVGRLSMLQLSHLRVDLRMAYPGWHDALLRGATEARQLGVPFELAVHLGPDGSVSGLAECGTMLKKIAVPVARVLAFRESEPASSLATLALARRHLELLTVPIGGGSDAHFCELNREQALGRFGGIKAEFISWPITPQVHTFDDLSVMENLEAQPHTVTSAFAFAEGKPLVVSPITLRPRFNAVATGEDHQDANQLPPQVDARQLSMFNAAWTLGSIAGLAAAKVASLTYFETTGWRGLMETSPPSACHSLFPAHPGMVFPVYSIFAALAGFSRMAPLPSSNLYRNTLASLCLFDAQGKRRLLCANLTASDLPLVLELEVEQVSVRTLNENAVHCDSAATGLAWSAVRQQQCPSKIFQLVLPGYAIVSIDSVPPT